jgi:hypothetical protein
MIRNLSLSVLKGIAWAICGYSAIIGGDSQGADSTAVQAAELLVQARFSRPTELERLWDANDGLPRPDEESFALAAARFTAEHPTPAADVLTNEEWTVDRVGSRQCKLLFWLADGNAPQRKAIADLAIRQASYLTWAASPSFGRRPNATRSFFAATVSLALTGQILHKAVPAGSTVRDVALQWALGGRGSLATFGAKGESSLAQAARKAVEAVPIDASLLDLHLDRDAFFASLDLERPDMAEVALAMRAGDFSAAEEAYVSALARRFSRDWHWPDIDFSPDKASAAEADDVCRNIFILKAHMYRRYDFGKEVDWSLVVDNDIESRVHMNHHTWMCPLLEAYRLRGDDKYVEHLCRLLNSWYRSSPPTFKRTEAQWRTLEAGKRTSQKWPVVLLALADHPRFRREALFVMARSMLDHGRYMTMYSAGGGNWLQVESSGLACIAALFPEFRLSPMFYEVAMSRLSRVNAKAFLSDGFQSECSASYLIFPLTSLTSALRLSQHQRLPIPAALLKQYEAAIAALAHISYPDGTLPQLNDDNPKQTTIADAMRIGAEMYGRDDFRWFATAGREGRPPRECSHDFTHAGYCVMRDRWSADGQTLIFDAGYFGSGHQHEDKLNFVFFSGRRELIGDPGIYSYKHDEMELYWRGTWSHNTVTVDDLSQHRALGSDERLPDADRRFVRGDGFDFSVGWFRGPWSPRKNVTDRAAATRAFQHQRCIFYRKGQYAVIADRVLGEGKHQVDLNFQLAPIMSTDPANQTVRPVTLEKQSDGVVITRENELANVALLPGEFGHAELLDLIGQKKPARGWYAMYGIQPSHHIVYRRSAALPIHFETVVQPLPPGRATPLQVRQRELSDVQPPDCASAALACGDDLFLLSYSGPARMTCGSVRFHGTAALLTGKQGKFESAMLIDGKQLEIDGQPVYDVETPRAAIKVELRSPQ